MKKVYKYELEACDVTTPKVAWRMKRGRVSKFSWA